MISAFIHEEVILKMRRQAAKQIAELERYKDAAVKQGDTYRELALEKQEQIVKMEEEVVFRIKAYKMLDAEYWKLDADSRTLREAAQMALEALCWYDSPNGDYEEEIDALKEVLK